LGFAIIEPIITPLGKCDQDRAQRFTFFAKDIFIACALARFLVTLLVEQAIV